MPPLFVYGSLMCPEIMERVAGLRTASRPATLHHFRRSRLRNLDYPGIYARQEARVDGLVFFDLPASALQRLDDFEGDQYLRQQVEVVLEDGTVLTAMAYVLQAHCQTLVTDEDWDFLGFLATGRNHFLATYCGFDKLPDNQGPQP